MNKRQANEKWNTKSNMLMKLEKGLGKRTRCEAKGMGGKGRKRSGTINCKRR